MTCPFWLNVCIREWYFWGFFLFCCNEFYQTFTWYITAVSVILDACQKQNSNKYSKWGRRKENTLNEEEEKKTQWHKKSKLEHSVQKLSLGHRQKSEKAKYQYCTFVMCSSMPWKQCLQISANFNPLQSNTVRIRRGEGLNIVHTLMWILALEWTYWEMMKFLKTFEERKNLAAPKIKKEGVPNVR